MTDTRQIIDFAADDNGAEMRSALYASIHDRVTQHLDNYKQELAKTMFTGQPDGATESEVAINTDEQEDEEVESSEEE